MSSARFGNLPCIGGLPSSSMSGHVLQCPVVFENPGLTERQPRSVQVCSICAACAGTRGEVGEHGAPIRPGSIHMIAMELFSDHLVEFREP